jgi:hypothetical protein
VKKNLPLALFAALLSVGGITACAQSSTTQSKESDPVMAEFERAAAAADAAVVASAPEANNVEKPTMEEETKPSKPVGPPIPSTLLEDRILTLVDSLRAPSDVTRANLEKVMAIGLTEDEKWPAWWWYTGITDKGWEYTVQIEKDDELPLINISFSAGDIEQDAKATVCTYELEAFARLLTNHGYIRVPGWQQPRGHLVFTRDSKETRFGTTLKVYKYLMPTGKEKNEFQHCVYSIHVAAGESIDGE